MILKLTFCCKISIREFLGGDVMVICETCESLKLFCILIMSDANVKHLSEFHQKVSLMLKWICRSAVNNNFILWIFRMSEISWNNSTIITTVAKYLWHFRKLLLTVLCTFYVYFVRNTLVLLRPVTSRHAQVVGNIF